MASPNTVRAYMLASVTVRGDISVYWLTSQGRHIDDSDLVRLACLKGNGSVIAYSGAQADGILRGEIGAILDNIDDRRV